MRQKVAQLINFSYLCSHEAEDYCLQGLLSEVLRCIKTESRIGRKKRTRRYLMSMHSWTQPSERKVPPNDWQPKKGLMLFLPVRLSRMPVRRLISRRKNWLPESEPTSRIFRVLKRGAQNPRFPLSTALSPLSA